MVSINERFMDFQVAQQVRWIRLQNREVREALRTLRAAELQVKRALDASNLDEGRFTKARLNALQKQINELIAELSKKLTPILIANVAETMQLAAEIEEAAFVRMLPAGLDVTTPNLGVLQSAAASSPFNGAPIGDWAKVFHRSLTETTWNTIVDGITSGMTNSEVTRSLLGTQANQFKDGALQARRRGLEALVRTSINHAANQGRQMFWEANTDLIKGVRWVSTLDTRTTPICQHRDGRVGPVSLDDPEWSPPSGSDRLEPPMARPPAHVNCRSTTVAVTKSWRELGFDVDELPPATRASMDGQVPANVTYYDWLKKQSSSVQEEVLGPTRLAMWKQHGVTPDRFTNDKGSFLTLAQIKGREIRFASSTRSGLPSNAALRADHIALREEFKWLSTVSGVDKTALSDYVRGNFSDFSAAIRSGAPLEGRYARSFDALNSMTRNNRVKGPAYVYRGIKESPNFTPDLSFTSTSISPHVAKSFSGTSKTILEIEAPARGFPGIYIDGRHQSQKALAWDKRVERENKPPAGETEVLLPPQTRLRQTGERTELINGEQITVIEVEILEE